MGTGSNIPDTKQTNPKFFPDYVFVEYPKQITKRATAEDVHTWKAANKKVDEKGQTYWERPAPRVGDPIPILATLEHYELGVAAAPGEPIVVVCEEDEIAICRNLGIERPKAITVASDNSDLKRENDALRAELAALQDRPPANALAGVVREPAPVRAAPKAASVQAAPPAARGWPKGKKRGPKVAARAAKGKRTMSPEEFAATIGEED